MRYYEDKADVYYNNVREDLISLMSKNTDQRVLEIGAGGGDTLVSIKERKLAKEVVGVDLFRLENTNQNNPLIDKFLIIDIEKNDLQLEEDYFDTVICGDVLEHLVDPWLVVKRLANYLKPGGLFIISVPNIRNHASLFKIFAQGTFDYDPAGGILDKTHLRFFCRKNVSHLMDTPKLQVQKVIPIHDHPKYKFSRKAMIFNTLTGRIFEEFLVSQYLCVGKRINPLVVENIQNE